MTSRTPLPETNPNLNNETISPELKWIIEQLRGTTNWNIWAVVWTRYYEDDGTTIVDNTQEYSPRELLQLLVINKISENQIVAIIRQLSNDSDDVKFADDGIATWVLLILRFYSSWKSNISAHLKSFFKRIILEWISWEFWSRFRKMLGTLLKNKNDIGFYRNMTE